MYKVRTYKRRVTRAAVGKQQSIWDANPTAKGVKKEAKVRIAVKHQVRLKSADSTNNWQ
jgi:hypothetical protein